MGQAAPATGTKTTPAGRTGARRVGPSARRGRSIVTPEGIAIPVTIASRSARIGALLLDLVILALALFAIDLVIDLIAGGTAFDTGPVPGDSNAAAREFLVTLGVILGFFGWYGYFLVQELGPRGATLGKRIVGIRVAARGGARLTPEAVIARNLLRDVELFYPLVYMIIAAVLSLMGELSGGFIWAAASWFALFALFPFFNKDALRAGDIVAGTWVVEAPRTRLRPAISTTGAAARESDTTDIAAADAAQALYRFSESELAIYGERELQTLERLLREDNAKALAAVRATICRKIGRETEAGAQDNNARAFLEAYYAQLRARLETNMRFGIRKADKHS